MKRYICSLIAVIVGITISGCSGIAPNDSGNTRQNESNENVQQKVEPVNLEGTWKSEDVNVTTMEATISTDTIEIDWLTDGGNTRSIYWIGSFTAPTDDNENYSWTSTRDAEKTDNALLASRDDTKSFSYSGSNEAITFELSALGQTRTISLTKIE